MKNQPKMKTFNFVIAFLIVSMNVLGQNSYYWYKGEKIPLTETTNKRFILLEDENIESVLAKPEVTSWKIDSKGIDNTVTTLIPYNNVDSYPSYRWEIIENIGKESSLPPKLKEQKFYSTPFFKTQQGEEVGLSHLFYVKLFKKSDTETLEKMAIENNVKIIGKNRYMPLWHTLACTKNSKGNALEMANMFFESGEFDAAEPDLMVDDLLQCVNDTYFDDQWHLNNDGQYGGTSGIDINICDAWGITEGCNDIVIAVVDQGIELNHPDLLNMFPNNYDTETNTSPSIVYGPHGTACAGIIGAASGNNDGVAGVAPECQLMSISNELLIDLNIRQQLANGINWAWHNGADVISNSWGGPINSTFIDNAIDSALTFGRNGLGCLVVFASGNDNSSVNYPANSNPDIITVGAMSPCGERKRSSSNSSEVGPGVTPDPNGVSCDSEKRWGSNYGNELDLVAPGVLIPTTDREGINGYNPDTAIHVLAGGNKITSDYTDDDYTVWFNGTSSACPQVAGVAALVLSINPNLTQDQVRDIIESTCTKVGSYNYSTVAGRSNGTWDDEVGYGCVNAFEALKAVYPITGPSYVCTSGTEFFIENANGATIEWDQSSNIYRDSPQGSNPCTFSAVGYGNGWISATVNGVELPRIDVFSEYTNLSGRFIERGSYLWKTLYSVNTVQADEVTVEVTEPGVSSFDWSLESSNGTVYWGTLSDDATMYFNLVTASDVHFEVSYEKGECGEVTNNYHFIKGNRLSLAIAPNPTTGEATLVIKSESEEKDFDDNVEWDMEIYSPMQALKTKKTRLKGKSTTIQTAGWTEGVYTVRVKYKDEILTGKLIVRK
jgi:hypothetical protein